MTKISEQLAPVFSAELKLENITHAYFTRHGGVSMGVYEGLNVGLGSDDDQVLIKENRTRVAGFFGQPLERLSTVYQVHSPDVVVIDKPMTDERPKADAIVTKTPGIIVGALTADCGPVLFADEQSQVIGSAHAGWKGATGGVLESTIDAMCSLGAKRENITAILGPTISQKNYEVGPEFTENLFALNPDNRNYLVPSIKDNHHMFDLPTYIVERLKNAGVKAGWTGHCTYANEDDFYSYRRTTHRNEADFGRQIAAIAINEK